jgi:hypothetical protein
MARAGKVIDRDRGWKRVLANFREAKGASVKVGILASAGMHKGETDGGEPLTVAQIAAVHEYGSEDGRIPQRSFIRSAVDESQAEIRTVIAKAGDAIVAGKMDVRTGMGIIGAFVKSRIQRKLVSGPFHPLSRFTIARRMRRLKSGRKVLSTKPLIDTGQLRASVDYEVTLGRTSKP